MYKYKQTTDVEVGDLVVWTDPSSPSRILKNKPYRVTSTSGTIVAVQDELGSTSCYGSVSRKTLFTKPAEQAAVGDYMYRITSGSNAFPQHSVIKITRTGNSRIGYFKDHGVYFEEVIIIAQAEPEVKYPIFKQWKKEMIKFDGLTSGVQLTTSDFFTPGEYKTTWTSHTDPRWNPCDFTIEPEIFDLDWWQARFEAGLPVYATDTFGTSLCGSVDPKVWKQTDYTTTFSMTDHSLTQKVPMSKEDIKLFKQQVPLSTLHLGLCNEISLGATTECSLQPTTKEQPMNKTTLKLLLELLGASEEVKDATNSKFVGIITNEDEYVGYMYFDSKEDAAECMAQPKMELHKLHLFEKSCVLAQKPRKVIEV